jgi:ankyrin repeat protein
MLRSPLESLKRSRLWSAPWCLILVLGLFAATTLYPLLPELWDPPRRAGYSADRNLDELVYEIYWGDLSQVRRAAERVRNINEHDITGNAPLGHAAVTGRLDAADVCRLLIDRGANLNIRDRAGNTPLIIAACLNHQCSAAELLRAGADPHASNDSGITALHYAADASEAVALVEMLLEAGADPRARDHDGKTPRDYARDAANLQVMAVMDSLEQSKIRTVASRSEDNAP